MASYAQYFDEYQNLGGTRDTAQMMLNRGIGLAIEILENHYRSGDSADIERDADPKSYRNKNCFSSPGAGTVPGDNSQGVPSTAWCKLNGRFVKAASCSPNMRLVCKGLWVSEWSIDNPSPESHFWRWFFHIQLQGRKKAWHPGNSAGDLFGMVKWPFQGLSDLHLGYQKVTRKNLVPFCFRPTWLCVGMLFFQSAGRWPLPCKTNWVQQVQWVALIGISNVERPRVPK